MNLKEYYKNRLNALMEQEAIPAPGIYSDVTRHEDRQKQLDKDTDDRNAYQNSRAKAYQKSREGDRSYDSVEDIRAGIGFGANSAAAENKELAAHHKQRESEERFRNRPKTVPTGINPAFSPGV